MTNKATQFSSENQPKPRGKGKRSLIIEALREEAMMGIEKGATQTECEKAWFKLLVKNAVDPTNQNGGLCLRLVTERGWGSIKPSSDLVEFEFDADAPPDKKAAQVLKATSDGIIPVDHAAQFIAAINSMVSIEASTELKARIEEIEKKLLGA